LRSFTRQCVSCGRLMVSITMAQQAAKDEKPPEGIAMALVRAIGRLGLTGLVVNCIIGASIFGLPGDLYRQLGRASPLAMVAGALCMAVFIACAAEVGSHSRKQAERTSTCDARSGVFRVFWWPGSGSSPVRVGWRHRRIYSLPTWGRLSPRSPSAGYAPSL